MMAAPSERGYVDGAMIRPAYGIRGQFDNFTHANAVLMRALEIDAASF